MKKKTIKKSKSLFPLLILELIIFFLLNLLIFISSTTTTHHEETTKVVVFFFISWIISSWLSKIYIHERTLIYTREAFRLFVFLFLFVSIFFLGSYIFKTSNYLMHGDIEIVLLALFITIFLRLLLFTIIRLLRKKHTGFQENIHVLKSKESKSLIEHIETNTHIGLKNISLDSKLFMEKNFSQLKKTIEDFKISVIFIPIEEASKIHLRHLLNLKWEKKINIQLYANYDYPIKNAYVDYFGLVQSFPYRSSPLEINLNKKIKRFFDIIFSVYVILFILSWMYPVIALLIKADSSGPVLFVQKRNGLNNKVFSCFKFRSMLANNDLSQVKINDSRITIIGRMLRRTSLDEFPQFLNVLMGDMSVVGPRPHMEIHNKNYSKNIKNKSHPFQQRHSIKPGITGLAQVRGFRGEIKGESDIINRIKYDIFYVKHWTFILDIKIILRTVINLIRGEEKAY